MTRSPHLLAFGGAHIDRRGYVSGAYMPAASNPGTLREEVGGGTFNALRWAVRRGLAASLCSMRGGDDAGDRVARATNAAGIRDLSAVFLDRATPSYTALIDADGELIAGLADMGLYDLAFPKQMRRSKLREAAAGADALLCDANLPTAALERCLDLAGGKPCFGIAISPAKVVRFTPLLGRLSVLFMNRREAVAMTGQATTGTGAELVAALRRFGLEAGVVTGGGGPLLGYDADGAFTATPPALRAIAPRDKRVALFFWNHPVGEKNLAASNLNLPKSLAKVSRRGSPVRITIFTACVVSLFAAFLGYNPMGELIPADVLHALPAQNATILTGNTFFPELMSGPFKHGLVFAFTFSAVLYLVAAFASWRGGRRVEVDLPEMMATEAAGRR